MSSNLAQTLTQTLNDALFSIVNFVPRIVSGIIVLLLGVIIGAFLKQVLLELFKILKVDTLIKRYGVPDTKEGVNWGNILAELVRWFVIILFLIPVADVWGLEGFRGVLSKLLEFLPNLFVAILLLIVGFVVSKLVYDLILASVHGLSKESGQTIAVIGRWSVLIFVFLVVLNQLKIADDLIKILFAGFVAMLAIAGGLAFGLGGKDAAKEILERVLKKL